MIEAAAKLPPGPEAWEPIFEAYPEVTPEELIEKFRQSAERAQREADQLRAYARQRGSRDPRVKAHSVAPTPTNR